MYWEEVHGYGPTPTYDDDDDDQPSGLSRKAWARDKDIVREIMREPDANDLVKPPDIYEMFDGPTELVGRTPWGNAFGRPRLDENGEYIDPDALVEQWKVRYYEFRKNRDSSPPKPYKRENDDPPGGLSREAWRRDKRIIQGLLREPGAHDLVDPPQIERDTPVMWGGQGRQVMFDGSDLRFGATFWGDGFGAPQYDEDGNYIPHEKRVERWKVNYYQFRLRRDKETLRLLEQDQGDLGDNYNHGGRRYDEESGQYVSTNPRANRREQSGDNYYNAKNTYDRIFRRMYPEGRDYDGD